MSSTNLEGHVARWIGIGLSTDPADWDAAEEAALSAYKALGFTSPKTILRVASPYAAVTLGREAARGVEDGAGVTGQVSARLGHHSGPQTQDLAWLRAVEAVQQPVARGVWGRVGWNVWETLRDQALLGLDNSSTGQFYAAFPALVSFLRDEMGWGFPSRYRLVETLAASCGWVWWHKDILAISDRPTEILFDSDGRLHSDRGPAIRYRDGWGVYAWHGVRIPLRQAYIITDPDRITCSDILYEPNVAVRRLMIERYGTARFVVDVGACKIHTDDYGTLYWIYLRGDEPLTMVKVVNATREPDGSWRDYFLRVPPSCRTAREAVAWTFGMEPGEYDPEVET